MHGAACPQEGRGGLVWLRNVEYCTPHGGGCQRTLSCRSLVRQWCFFVGSRHCEAECAALAGSVALGPDRAAVGLDDLFADRQPQTSAADAVARVVLDAVEAIENLNVGTWR